MELLEQISIACDYLLKSDVTIPNGNVLASLLNKAMTILNEIQSDSPTILQYQKLTDEKKQSPRTDEEGTVPYFSPIDFLMSGCASHSKLQVERLL
jgi:hypothetical protein